MRLRKSLNKFAFELIGQRLCRPSLPESCSACLQELCVLSVQGG
jgi:hypothetical protein